MLRNPFIVNKMPNKNSVNLPTQKQRLCQKNQHFNSTIRNKQNDWKKTVFFTPEEALNIIK